MENYKYRICPYCGKSQDLEYFLPMSSSSKYSINGKSPICIECLAKNIDRHDLDSINKMCQFLDLPFDPNKWIEMEKKHEKLGPLLLDYCFDLCKNEYKESNWIETTKQWEKIRDYGEMVDKMTSIQGDLLIYLRKKWGSSSDLTLDDYMKMEEYEKHTLSHYPYKDEARKDMVRKLAKLSVLSDISITSGNTKDAVSYIQAYNTLTKELGIGTEVLADDDTITSLSELVSYLEKKGFLLNYRINENRDVVDSTIQNMEQYVRRLFNDSQETVHEMYNQQILTKDSGTVIDDDDLEALYAGEGDKEVEIEETLNEEELEDMFRQVEVETNK